MIGSIWKRVLFVDVILVSLLFFYDDYGPNLKVLKAPPKRDRAGERQDEQRLEQRFNEGFFKAVSLIYYLGQSFRYSLKFVCSICGYLKHYPSTVGTMIVNKVDWRPSVS